MANEIKGKNTGKHDNKSLISITEEGCVFKSYIDGRKIKLTPESATHIQQQLGADLFMQFDECTPYHVDKDYTARSMEMSMRWGDRCLSEFEHRHDGSQAMYGIIQGGVHADLRRISAEYTAIVHFSVPPLVAASAAVMKKWRLLWPLACHMLILRAPYISSVLVSSKTSSALSVWA